MKQQIHDTILSILEDKRADGDVLPCGCLRIENNKKRNKNEVKEMDK